MSATDEGFGIRQLLYQTADGETGPTSAVIRRVDGREINAEGVSTSRPGANPIGHGRTRPIAAKATEVPQRTVVQIDKPATDEVKLVLPNSGRGNRSSD